MRYAACKRQAIFYLTECAVLICCLTLLNGRSAAQASRSSETPTAPTDELSKYPGLLSEFGQLFLKIQAGVQAPPLRTQSKLLPLLPDSTLYYGAFPNYGDAAHQALNIFHHELETSAVLRQWWYDKEMATTGPKIDDALGKFYELSQYLGDEVIVSGTGTPDRSLLMIAEVRKPGLKDFLIQLLKETSAGTKPSIRVLDAQELATAKDAGGNSFSVLVLPNFVVAAPTIQTLRTFNGMIATPGQLAATPFGQRLLQEYSGGVSVLAGVDLQSILKQNPPPTAEQKDVLARSGFGDAKYLVWEHKGLIGQASSQTELSFTGPRHGAAAWLAAPAQLHSLDFVSPNTLFTVSVLLKNLGKIFDDLRDLSAHQNPNPLASLAQMEQAMNLSLQNDVLSHFDGELTLTLDNVQPEPAWTAIARVNDPDGLQRTLNKLLMSMPMAAEESEEAGVRYHTLRVPSPKKATEIAYAFTDGFVVIGSSRQMATEAIHRRQSGNSLSNSQKFVSALPPGHPEGLSALFYEDPVAIGALAISRTSPEFADTFSQFHAQASPVVMCGYGEESALRQASTNSAADAGAILVMGAIAIPNLLRARIAANESAAVGNMRTINTAQISYQVSYPQKGFARDLASLGPDPRGPNLVSARHASLLDSSFANPACTANAWCAKSGYSFNVRAVCGATKCTDFVSVATPLSTNTGMRTFCSTSDAVIRMRFGGPFSDLISPAQCRRWPPLQ